MRQVVAIIPEQKFVLPHQVSIRKYYGFTLDDNSPGFISAGCMATDPYSYQAKFFYEMTGGNTWSGKHSTLEECVKTLFKSGAKVYEFDTYRELLKWGSEQ